MSYVLLSDNASLIFYNCTMWSLWLPARLWCNVLTSKWPACNLSVHQWGCRHSCAQKARCTFCRHVEAVTLIDSWLCAIGGNAANVPTKAAEKKTANKQTRMQTMHSFKNKNKKRRACLMTEEILYLKDRHNSFYWETLNVNMHPWLHGTSTGHLQAFLTI